MVRHQAEDVNEPVVPCDHICEEFEEVAAVVVAAEDRCSIDSASADVIGAVGEDESR